MTDPLVIEIEKALAEITPGDWKVDNVPALGETWIGNGKELVCPQSPEYGEFDAERARANADFIANAPRYARTLLQALKTARRDALEAAADAILVRVTMELGRYLYDAPDMDLVPLLAKYKVELTAKMFMDLHRATDDRAAAIRAMKGEE